MANRSVDSDLRRGSCRLPAEDAETGVGVFIAVLLGARFGLSRLGQRIGKAMPDLPWQPPRV
jgi:hypothetical protein